MVDMPENGTSERSSTKRKRESVTTKEEAESNTLSSTLSDLVFTLSGDSNTQALLTFKSEAVKLSLIDRLRSSDYGSLEELLDHLNQVLDAILPTLKKHDTRNTMIQTHKRISAMVRLAKKDDIKIGDTPTEASESPRTFPDRQDRGKTLFASTVVGPLFTSMTYLSANESKLDLPSHIQLIDVLPTAANEPRALEDLYQSPLVAPTRSRLDAGRQPLTTTRPILRSQNESFGPDLDSSEATLSQATRHLLLLYRQQAREFIPATNGEVAFSGVKGDIATDAQSSAQFDFADDLLDTFETREQRDDDISSMLMELAALQTARLAAGPFSSPSEEEQSLAQKTSSKLQEAITTKDIKPGQLLPNGVRPDYSLARFTSSYVGTLPPTIAQAVRATYSQVVPVTSRPLQTSSRSMGYPAKDGGRGITGNSNRASTHSTPRNQHSQVVATKTVP